MIIHHRDHVTLVILVTPGGEPLNENAYWWLHNVVGEGRCTVVDNCWQTGEHSIVLSHNSSSECIELVRLFHDIGECNQVSGMHVSYAPGREQLC